MPPRLTDYAGTHYFVYDPTASVPAVVYEQGPTNRYLNIRQPDGALLTRETYDDSGTRTMSRTYHFDGQGSTIALTNENGQVTDTYSYDAWGNVTPGEANITTDNPYQFGGQFGYYTHYQEPSFTLIQTGFRYYDPSTGRYTQRDPIMDSLSAYSYAGNNPLGYVDPWGLAVKQPGFWEGLIPVWGSGRAAVDDFQNGLYIWGVANLALAATDVVPARSAAKAGWKVGGKLLKGGVSLAVRAGRGVARFGSWLVGGVRTGVRAVRGALTRRGAKECAEGGAKWTLQEMGAYGRARHAAETLAWKGEGFVLDSAKIPGSLLRPDGMDLLNKVVRELKPRTESGIEAMRQARRKYMDALERAFGSDHGWTFEPRWYDAPWGE